jgi:Site-specific recombinase XerD
MGVRYRKYLSGCKDISCKGKEGKHCPSDRPSNLNGNYKTCGAWVVELFDESSRWKTIAFRDVRNKRDAERRLAMLIGDRERGILKLPKKRNIPTLDMYCKEYLESYKADKENTRMTRGNAVRAITKYLGNYKLDKINKFIIEKYRIERKEKDSVSNVTINSQMKYLSHIFNTAVHEGILDKNPCSGVRRYKIKQKRDRILTGEEIALISDSLKGRDRLMILMSLFVGLRLNETLKLEKKDIDFDNNLITFVPSKTGKLMVVPISNFLAHEIKEYMKGCPDERLFDNREVNHSLVKYYSKYFSNLFKTLGIDNFTYHCLRHCFSTFHSDSGSDPFTTQSLLGHSSLAQTAVYTHKKTDAKRKAIEDMTEHVLNMSKYVRVAKLC